MNGTLWLHWYMAAFFGLFGATMIAVRARLGDVCHLIPGIRGDDAAQHRLHRVLEQRSCIEAMPRSLGLIVGLCSIVLAVVAAFPWSSIVLLYALLTLVLALGLFAGYVRLRGVGRRRAASLSARNPWAVAPWYVYAATLVAVLLPLAAIAETGITAVIVTFSGLLILGTARNVASLPALLIGEDPSVERFVDERLRAVRTINLIGTSTAPVVVFFGFTTRHVTPVIGFAELYVCLLLCVLVVRQFRIALRTPSGREVASWSPQA